MTMRNIYRERHIEMQYILIVYNEISLLMLLCMWLASAYIYIYVYSVSVFCVGKWARLQGVLECVWVVLYLQIGWFLDTLVCELLLRWHGVWSRRLVVDIGLASLGDFRHECRWHGSYAVLMRLESSLVPCKGCGDYWCLIVCGVCVQTRRMHGAVGWFTVAWGRKEDREV
jgi:hypothetical protein